MTDPLKQVRSKQGSAALGDSLGHDSWLADKCTLVHAMLTRCKDEHGAARRTSTVTVFCDEQDGRFKAVLKDRTSMESLWVTIDDLGQFWEALEDSLDSNGATWRKNRPPHGGRS